MSLLQARFAALGDTWQDQEHAKFSEEFRDTMKVLKKFIESSNVSTRRSCCAKAQRIEEYLNQHATCPMKLEPMPERAKVTSLEALETSARKLIVYRDKASRVLDEVSDDVTRTRVWLETSARLTGRTRSAASTRSGNRATGIVQRATLRLARRLLRPASRRGKSSAAPSAMPRKRPRPSKMATPVRHPRRMPARQVEKLRHFLGHDVARAINVLNEAIKTSRPTRNCRQRVARGHICSIRHPSRANVEEPARNRRPTS
jgi:hypothetical protein